MPHIRKKTSNRVKTRDREKIKKKVRDGRKKNAKAAKKKDLQWKSKKKDPGIPNDFPYKDQILAEIQQQRRIAAEAPKKKASLAVVQAEVEETPKEHVSLAQEEEEEEEAPMLLNHDLPNLLSVLEKSDVILEVLDARDPLAFRIKQIEDIVAKKRKKIFCVLNKIDRSPREAVAAWAEHLRAEHPTLLFRSASAFLPEEHSQNSPSTRKSKGKLPIHDALGAESIIACLSECAKAKDGEKLTVAVVGLTNVGKSSLINSLLKKSSLPVYTITSSSQGPSTTELPQEVSLNVNGATITLIDTPGLSFVVENDVNEVQTRANDILLRCKGRIDRLKDPILPVPHIVSRACHEDLMLLYNLPAFPKGDFAAFLSGVARANHLVNRKGDLDLKGAARIVLRDWNSGRFARYTPPPTVSSREPLSLDSTFTSFIAPLYGKDPAILAVLATRKEIWKKGGLVKLSSSGVEERKVTLEEDWTHEDESGDGHEGNSDCSAIIVLEESKGQEQEQEDDEEGGSQNSEDEDENAPPLVSQSQSHERKRKQEAESQAVSRPTKRVSLAPLALSKKKDKLRTRQQNISEAKINNELASATAKFGTAPKSILKKVTKGRLPQKDAAKKPVMKAGLQSAGQGDAKEPETYDFGRFF